MKRILVIGPGGAGKTTFATALAEILDLPVVHLDSLFWLPGWNRAPTDEWLDAVERWTRRTEWVMDGNYGSTLDARIAAADAIVFLDTPRLVCIARVLWRRLKYAGRSRPSMPEGCPERITMEFLYWIWTYGTRRRPQVLALLDRPAMDRHVVVLRSAREARRYLESLDRR